MVFSLCLPDKHRRFDKYDCIFRWKASDRMVPDIHKICRYNVVDRDIEYGDSIYLYKDFDVDMENFHMDFVL